jgi:Zn-dependent peptidase ImmA (M78 family)
MRLVDVLLAARSITNEYEKRNYVNSPIQIIENGLKDIIEHQTSQKITISCLPWSGGMFAARLDRYKAASNIRYSESLNTCWSRFYIAKELTHILCGDEKNYTKSILPLTDAIINDIELTDEMEDCMLEFQAFYGAIELLLPSFLSNKLYELEKNGETYRKIAETFRIPEKVIAFRLSESGKSIFDNFEKKSCNG